MDLYHTLFVAVTQAFLGSYVMLLIDFRKPVSIWRTQWIVTVVLVACANLIGLLFLNFWDTYRRVGVLTVTVPYILFTIWCSSHRDFRAVFHLATALFVGCIGTVNANFAELFLKNNQYCDYYSLAVRTASFLPMFFVLRRFSFTYQQMLYQLNRSWGVLCIIPMTTFLTILYAINHLENSVSRVPCEQENRRTVRVCSISPEFPGFWLPWPRRCGYGFPGHNGARPEARLPQTRPH